VKDFVNPGTGGVDQHARRHHLALAGRLVRNGNLPDRSFAHGLHNLRAGADDCSPLSRIARVEHHQPCIIDPAIGIFKGLVEKAFERFGSRVRLHVENLGGWQELAASKMVVKEQAKTQQPRWPHALVVWQHEPHRPDDVRRILPKDLSFHQCFAHESEFIMFQIAETAVDQFGRAGRRAARQIIHFSKENRKTTPYGIARDTAAIDPSANNEEVVNRILIHFCLENRSPTTRSTHTNEIE